MTAGDRPRRCSCSLLALLLSFLLLLRTDAADYAKICELQYSPLVSLEYDPVTGQISLANDSTTENDGQRVLSLGKSPRRAQLGSLGNGSKKFLRGGRLLDSSLLSNETVATNTSTTREKIFYNARSCPCDKSGRTYCIVDGRIGSVPMPDACGIPWADNIHDLGKLNDHNLTESAMYNALEIGCFQLDSQVVFSRNAWPVIFLWYGALLLFLLATSNGKFARGYVVHKLCPRLRTNELQVERIMAQRNDTRNRMHMASLRDAQHMSERPERFFARSPRVRIPSGLSWRSGISDEEQRHESTRWWLQQAELMGIITRAAQPQQVEYVLKTRAFNAERERARRSRMRQISAISNATSDECDHNHDAASCAVPRCKSRKEAGGSSTRETVATTFSESDEEHTLNETHQGLDAPPPIVLPQNIYCEEDDIEVFDCSICLTEIEDGEQVGILPCIHIFHVDCLRQWITRKNACPLCQITEIASPRPVEIETGRRVPPAADETTTAEGHVPNAEEGISNHEISTANATANNATQIGTPWQLLNPFTSTLDRSTLIDMEQRRFRREQIQIQQGRQRRRGPREGFVINLSRR